MQREDIDEYLRMYENDEFDNVEKVKKLLDRIGISYTETADGLSFDSQLLKEQFIEFFKQDKEYVKNMDKKLLGELVSELPEIVDIEYLERMILNHEEYGLETNQVFDFVIKINNPDFTKEIIDRRQEYGFNDKQMLKLIESVNEIDYTKNIIDNSKEYGISKRVTKALIRKVDNPNYIKEIIERWEEFDFKAEDIIEFARKTKDSGYIEKIIENREKYGIDDSSVGELAMDVENPEFLKNIVENGKKFDIRNRYLVYFLEKINDSDYAKSIIERREEFGINGGTIARIAKLTGDPRYIKEIVENREEYGLNDYDTTTLIDNLLPEEIMEVLENLGGEITEKYRTECANVNFVKENIEEFLKIEGRNKDKDLVIQMSEQNEDILKVDFDIIEFKYINSLGKDKINQIASYPDIVEKVLNFNEGELNSFGKLLDAYLEETKGEEWTPLANRLLKNIDGYKELTSNLDENVDFSKLLPIMIHSNDFEIKEQQDVENFQEIKRKKCEKLIKGRTNEEKQSAVFLKIFGHNRKESQELVGKFGQDIDKIQNKDLKSYIKSLQEILSTEDPKTLEEIFDQVEELEATNPLLMERMLKTEYGKLYNEGLFKIEGAKELGENMYSAGTDFNMIITSVGAFFGDNIQNYKEDWNRPNLGSQHFCASYIRNDMLGHAPVPNICYGFEEMKEDSLMLSGPGDIYSSIESFESDAMTGAFEFDVMTEEEYLAPDSQISNTLGYNEMDFRRVQGGEKKQPDYIVVFRKDGKIPNMDKAEKASKDFGDLPIVVIDEDECLASEKQKAEELFEEYQETGNTDVRKKLEEKLRNNRVTDDSFCRDTDMDVVLKSLDEKEETVEKETEPKVSMKDLDEIYGEVSGKERQEEAGKIKTIYEKIKNIKEREDDSDAR